MKKIPNKFRMVIFVFFMTLFIGLIMSAIMTWRIEGLSPDFLASWIVRFIQTWIIVIPTVAVVIPIVTKITNKLVENEN
ncbi:Protein of unknown function [Marivirga sericea]|uniref:DUF2798 domain-containing protein n=1 Tax=Marivirga sericea TaxID=1028 RepID=A0A1X7L0H8_9BACT|nr:DUF2798 domain-containing protein [Marivirga sericea]SMG47004.1 Protein of unknown function [Marivirga sericea]